MRTTTLLFAFFLLLKISADAQVWIEAGGKAGLHANGFINSNILNDNQHDYNLNMALTLGPTIGINFGDYHGLQFELLFAKNQQEMNFRGDTTGESTRNAVTWRTTEVNLLYRFYSEKGAYLELGPKIGLVQDVKQAFGTERSTPKEQYSKSYYGAIFGVGAFLAANETLTLKLGLRGEYALSDLVSEKGKTNNYPAYYTSYASYKPTVPVRVGVVLELTFGVGGVAKAGCGHRNIVFGTRYRR